MAKNYTNQPTHDEIMKALKQHKILEELFKTHQAEKALYDYMKQKRINIPDAFWIEELNNGIFLTEGKNNRTLEDDILFYNSSLAKPFDLESLKLDVLANQLHEAQEAQMYIYLDNFGAGKYEQLNDRNEIITTGGGYLRDILKLKEKYNIGLDEMSFFETLPNNITNRINIYNTLHNEISKDDVTLDDLINTMQNEKTFITETLENNKKPSMEEIQNELEEYYKLEEVFKDKPAEKAIYNYYKKIGINIPDAFWIDELSNGYILDGGTDTTKRTLEKDLSIYLTRIGYEKATISSETAFLLKSAEADGYTKLIEEIGNGTFQYVDSTGNLNSGLHIIKDIYMLDESKINREQFLTAVMDNLCTDNGFNDTEYKNIINHLKNPAVTKEVTNELINNLNNIDNPTVYQENYKKIHEKISETTLDYWNEDFNNLIKKLDDCREQCEKIGYEGLSSSDILTVNIYDMLDEEEKKEFATYLNNVMDTMVDANSTDKKLDALNIIINEQNKRLDEELKTFAVENELSTKFVQCNLDTSLRAKTVKDLIRLDKQNPLCGVIIDRNRALEVTATLVWCATNVVRNVKSVGKISLSAMNKVQSFNRSCNLQYIGIMNDISIGMYGRLGKLQYKLEHGNFISQKITQARIDFYKNAIEKLDKEKNKYAVTINNQNRAIEDRASRIEKLEKRNNSIHYLKGEEFKDFNDAEKEVLKQFSLVAKKSFTVDESIMILNAYVASEGRFTPETIQGIGIQGKSIMDVALEAKAGVGPLEISVSPVKKAIDFLKINRLNTTISENMIKIFGTDKFVFALPYETQAFLLDQYQSGAAVDILREEAMCLYNKKDYTVEDARENISKKMIERESDCNIELADIDLSKTEQEMFINLNSKTALQNLADLAKNMQSTVRLDFDDKTHRYNYHLVAAKNGKQFFLNVEDKLTGETVPYKSTEKILNEIGKSVHFAQQIQLKVKENEQQFEHTMKQENKQHTRKRKEKEQDLEL